MTAIRRNGDRYQILALSGGGFRGLFTADYLRRCEDAHQAQIHERFDLIAGTSIGALIASGLALGRPALELCTAMKTYGPQIFARSMITFPKRLMRASPYSTTVLEQAIDAVLTPEGAARPLSDVGHPLMITAVNYTRGTSVIFRSLGLAGARASNISVKQAILASAAAPTFFPLRKIETDQFADGGLVANAPDLVAVTETLGSRRATLDEIYVLSIGTAARREGAALHERPLSPSILSWFFVRGLVQTIMAAQEDLAISTAAQLIGERLMRIDEEPAQQQVAAIAELDRASPRAVETLQSLAAQAFERTGKKRQLRAFF
jgi:patatin-like phospholipase/acyl hydrolase